MDVDGVFLHRHNENMEFRVFGDSTEMRKTAGDFEQARVIFRSGAGSLRGGIQSDRHEKRAGVIPTELSSNKRIDAKGIWA